MSALLWEYELSTEINDHSKAAQLVVDALGTAEESAEIKQIRIAHRQRGYITAHDQQRRDEIVKKYYAEFRERCEKGLL